ncbi:response regulator, partial [Deltaproteobacteria bacterium PRO3]|nr:response regulator [Deltaproteobacteria bacterium PRO3]
MAPKILILEDESSIADNIRYALEAEGFAALWFSTLKEGREALARGGIDLVVLDVGLPDGNGFDFCRELRKTSAVPVIFLTARSGEVDRVEFVAHRVRGGGEFDDRRRLHAEVRPVEDALEEAFDECPKR